jgi:eukaryotic-like serine/threonine-protein kinase
VSQTDRWTRIESLYHQAAARPPSERVRFLNDACGDDLSLRRDVESLLAQDADGFLDRPALTPADSSPTLAERSAGEANSSPIGMQLGAYRVTGHLGTGGMGEVYSARDTRLGRDVAIKILSRAFTGDTDRLAHFEREARVLASLNHPNIGAIYGLEEGTIDGRAETRALVLELVEGETLADRIGRGPIRVPDAIAIARQIADALDAAHERGIVHRDLKPANIKITPGGVVKVLDFGLATVSLGGSDLTHSPTFTVDRTGAGVMLGTAPYMSPEQARGLSVDKRTDVWAFGCVLFEMLTGRRAFGGETLSDTIAAIIEREVEWTALPAETPPNVRRLLTRTLVKDPKRRLRDIADARFEFDDATAGAMEGSVSQSPARRSWPRVMAVSVVMVLVAVAAALLGRRFTPSAPERQQPPALLTVATGPGESFVRGVAISPDGAYISYIAGPPGDSKLYLRALAERQSRVVSELPIGNPFFSPDSQWLAVFDGPKLKKVAVRGGSTVTLADVPVPRGGAWGPDGSIVFSPAARAGLMLLPPAGGKPQVLTTLDAQRGETSHRYPSFLPDGKTVLFSAEGDTYAKRALRAISLDTRRERVVLESPVARAVYLPTGHLAYLENDAIFVVRFDPDALQVSGAPVKVLDGVSSFDVSSTGMLVYGRTDTDSVAARDSSLVWVNRAGVLSRLPPKPARYDHPRLSPDGRRIVFSLLNGTDRSIWIYDIARDASARLTFSGSNGWPSWTPDGRRVVYASNRVGTQWDIVAKPADGSGDEQTILSRPWTQLPQVVSSDGAVAYTETDPDRGDTLWEVSLTDGSKVNPLLNKTPGEMMPSFSPDGRWVAYVSPETGRNEIYVRARNNAPGKWQISTDGGTEPVWAPGGRELFYRSGDKLLAVDVETTPNFSFGKSRVLFEGSFVFGTTEQQDFDVSRDGQRFLMLKTQDDNRRAVPLEVIVNWFDEVARRAGAAAAR